MKNSAFQNTNPGSFVMSRLLKDAVRSTCGALGLEVRRKVPEPVQNGPQLPSDFDQETVQIIQQVRPFTMTSAERIASLCNAIKYIVKAGIEGDVVECGVWRGGSMMAVALELAHLGASRTLYLFDTFDGMSEPSDVDQNLIGQSASELLQTEDKATSHNWAYCPEEDVFKNVSSTGYDMSHVRLVKGKVEDTVPKNAPEKIALLRLDTDWYESTRRELVHLFPRLVPGGVLIIDDYGHWQGARKAVDEYIAGNQVKILLNRVDYTGRIGVKIAN
jgi:O-methyltransferase